jgi:hypothetical protein
MEMELVQMVLWDQMELVDHKEWVWIKMLRLAKQEE